MQKKAVVVQLGGAAPVVNKTLVAISRRLREYQFKVLGARYGIEGIMTNNYRELVSEEQFVEIARKPGAVLGTSETKVVPGGPGNTLKTNGEVSAGEIADTLKKQGVHYIYLIGGNSTAWIANEIHKATSNNYDLTVVHVLKTIDNDVAITDHTLGHGSCARYAAKTMYTVSQVNMTKRGIHLAITMGRDSGYIAASSGLLGGTDLIYVPEVNFDIDCFLNDVEDVLSINRRTKNGKGKAMISISEGIRQYVYENGKIAINEKGEPKYKLIADIASERMQVEVEKEKNLGGTSLSQGSKVIETFFYKLLAQRFPEVRVRTDVLGYAQQGYPDLSETDVYEAEHVGNVAVDYSIEKQGLKQAKSGSVIIERVGDGDTYQIITKFIELEKIAGKIKQMPRNYMSYYGKNPTDLYYQYAGPLIGYVEGFSHLDHVLSKPLEPKEFIKD